MALGIPLTEEEKKEIVRRAAAGEMKQIIASDFGISPTTVTYYTRDIKSPHSKRIDPDKKKELIDRVAKGEVIAEVARDLGINTSSESMRTTVLYLADVDIPEDKVAQVRASLLDGKTTKAIARELTLPLSAIRKIAGTQQLIGKKLAPETVARIVELKNQGLSTKVISKKIGVARSTVQRIVKEAVENGTAQPTFNPKNNDPDFSWIARLYPQLEDWRRLMAEWLAGEVVDRNRTLNALSHFVLRYLIKQNLPAKPAELLAIGGLAIPDFYEVACPKTIVGIQFNNAIHRFLEWVLHSEEFADHSSGEPVPNTLLFRNPVCALNFKGRVTQPRLTESNKGLMSYFLIHDLRRRIAQGRTFREWKWVQSILGRINCDGEAYGADWYEVDKSLVDKGKNDPNFVCRTRTLRGRVIHEAWSPVRFVAMLMNLIVPGRMGQIRMSDSGEADTYTYQGGIFLRNDGPLALGTQRKPRRQGILRQPEINDGDIDVLLYYNTNKTHDIGKIGADKGQECPWPKPSDPEDFADDPYYWLEALRDWQVKYNPIDCLTKWGDLPSLRNLSPKSDEQNAEYLDTAFLFRTPNSPGETMWPIPQSWLRTGWDAINAEYEKILADQGITHPGGSAILLIDPESGRTLSSLHGQRVSLITHMIMDGGMPPQLMMKIAGHARFIMTIYYCKPGLTHIRDAIANASIKLEATKTQAMWRDLAGVSAEHMRDHLVFNAEDWTNVLAENPADRNPLGWLDQHDGICLAGGNSGPVDGDQSVPGCHNGGYLGLQKRPYKLVPGGVRNCTRCRWKCAGKRHALGLAATLNNRQYHLHKAAEKAIAAERNRNDLLKQKMKVEAEGRPFDKMNAVRLAERLYLDAMERTVELANDVAAVNRMIDRISMLPDHTDGTMALALQGDEAALQVILEETDSELLVLTQICADVEFFPDLEPGVAVFEFAQLLDQAFERDGYPLAFARMSEGEKLTAANAFMRALEQYADPTNPHLARRKVVEILDRQESIEQILGVNLKQLISASGQPGKRDVSMRLINDDRGSDDQ